MVDGDIKNEKMIANKYLTLSLKKSKDISLDFAFLGTTGYHKGSQKEGRSTSKGSQKIQNTHETFRVPSYPQTLPVSVQTSN